MDLPSQPSTSVRKRNPHLYHETNASPLARALAGTHEVRTSKDEMKLNKTERRWYEILKARQYNPIWCQAFTLALDPPFKSYRPDLAYLHGMQLVLVEIKAPHRFRRAGIAKAALAAKTYPLFRFELIEWTDKGWKESVLSP